MPETGAAPSVLDDAALVAAARADRQAFRALYERYVQQIFGFCYVRLGSREAAEDATSEVFMKAMTGLAGFRGGVFAGWLFRIAANVVTDAHRRGRNQRWSLPLHLELADPMQQEQLDDAGISLHAALRTLPDDEQVTLELQLAGWTSDEIGAVLDRSPSAIRMTRARALRRLRASLAESGTELDPGASPW